MKRPRMNSPERRTTAWCLVAGAALVVVARPSDAQIAFDPAVVIQLPTTHFPTDVLPVDLDHDGDLDLVVPGRGVEGLLYVLRGNGDGSFMPPQAIVIGVPTDSVDSADLDADGHLDLVLAGRAALGRLVILRGRGDGTFDPPRSIRLEREPRGVALGDFDADGDLDAAATNYSTGSLSLATIAPDLSAEVVAARTLGREAVAFCFPQEVIAADLDEDGRLEAVIAALGNGRVQVVPFAPGSLAPGAPRGTRPPPAEGLQGGLTTCKVLDFDADGDLDVMLPLLMIGARQHVALLLNDGEGRFTDRRVIPSLFTGFSWSADAADLDLDGRIDLVVGSAIPGTLAVMRNITEPGSTGWSYFFPISYYEGSFVRAIRTPDLDGNGLRDVVAAEIGSHRVIVLINRSGNGVAGDGPASGEPSRRSAEPPRISTDRSLPPRPTVDLNLDGRLDATDLALELADFGPPAPEAPAEEKPR